MTVDLNARKRLFEDNRTKMLVDGMKDAITKAVSTVNSAKDQESDILKLVVKHEDNKETVTMLDKIGKAMVMLYKQVSKPVVLPKVFPISGSVEAKINKLPDIKVGNLNDLGGYFQALEVQISHLAQAVSSVPAPEIKIPKMEASKVDFTEVISALKDLKDKKKVNSNEDITDGLYKLQGLLEQLVSKPTFVPPAVTNVSINPLHGIIKTTTTSVGTTLTTLPGYGQLPMRRSVILFNNGANTIYYGGSDVTTANGTPVLSQTYSPSIDAGYDMVVYGIASTGPNDVRVMEISNTTVPIGTSLT